MNFSLRTIDASGLVNIMHEQLKWYDFNVGICLPQKLEKLNLEI